MNINQFSKEGIIKSFAGREGEKGVWYCKIANIRSAEGCIVSLADRLLSFAVLWNLSSVR